MKIAFNTIDLDHNGALTLEELRAVFDVNNKNDYKMWVKIMKEVDKNHDGSITFDEFYECMSKVMNKSFS